MIGWPAKPLAPAITVPEKVSPPRRRMVVPGAGIIPLSLVIVRQAVAGDVPLLASLPAALT